MTLCIAAVCLRDGEQAIVTASDFMLSQQDGWHSHEGRLGKIGRATGKDPEKWAVMFSGSSTIATIIRSEAIAELSLSEEIDTPHVINAYEDAFERALTRKIEDEILGRYQLTMTSFKATGLSSFGPEQFAKFIQRMDETQLGTSLLIGGFNKENFPVLLSISDPGGWTAHNDVLYHAIGIGWALATASLSSVFDPKAPLSDVIYRVCEAKFKGEGALGVGRKTILTVHRICDKTIKWEGISAEDMEQMRKLWESKGKPVPKEAARIVPQILKPMSFGAPASTTPGK